MNVTQKKNKNEEDIKRGGMKGWGGGGETKRQRYGREELEMVRKKGQIKGKGDKVLTWLIRQVGCRNTVRQSRGQ